ncbi:FecR family protein [Aquimarina sp. 2201CG14-23]|uniref:FecR family protein n=1 Tax=Aquimarina mycalae TaxID=3040073 RepID=UPI0024782321|nr:FecR family protein [Aquimarina sp. 2201CG14-23]MDH7447331.1 FecR domain-containing protein [Aquimarina sp. 2201CG14-23]
MSEDKDPYLGKWLNNDLTPQELEQLKKSEEFEDYEKIVKGLEYFHAPSFDEEKSLATTLQKLQHQQKGKVIRLKPLLYVISAAASVLLILGLFFNKVTYTADRGTQLAIILPDDSKVDLNAGSSLTYNRFFWSKNRVVTLEGEGLFTVKTGDNFVVSTDSGIIEVLGTVFNVKSRVSVFEVVCYEGKVRVGTNQNEEEIIQKGEGVLLKNGTLNKRSISESEPLWKRGESLFLSTPLHQVLDELERQYDVTFTRDNIDGNKLFSGGFVHNNISIALEAVFVPMNIEYVVNGSNIKLANK